MEEKQQIKPESQDRKREISPKKKKSMWIPLLIFFAIFILVQIFAPLVMK